MKRTGWVTGTLLLGLTLICGCSEAPPAESQTSPSPPPSSGVVTLRFLQNKVEARDIFNRLITNFQKEHPQIEVIQINDSEAERMLTSYVAKNDTPDLIAMGATDTFVTLANTDVFEDLSADPNVKLIVPDYIDRLRALSKAGRVNGIPYSANANGILYNKAIFEKFHVSVPRTWPELIALAQTLQQQNQVPFYFTLKESWTTLVPFNALASNLQGDSFVQQRTAGTIRFRDAYGDIARKQQALLPFGNTDRNEKSYGDGNAAFARGAAAMYIQGTWAVPEILKANPDIQLGIFPFPATDSAAANRLVSGIDNVLAIAKNTRHPREAHAFLDFLLKSDSVQTYMDNQKAIATEVNMPGGNPLFGGLEDALQRKAIVDFADHSFPNEMNLDQIVQKFLFKGDTQTYLNELDQAWDATH